MKTLPKYILAFVAAAFLLVIPVPLQAKSVQQIYDQANARYNDENYPEALSLFTQAMERAEKEGDTKIFVRSIGYISNIYNTFGDDNACRYYLLKGYREAKRTGDKRMQTRFLPNVVRCLANMGEIEEAKKYYNALVDLLDDAGDLNARYYALYSKALILKAELRYDAAIEEHLDALEFARKNKMGEMFSLYQLNEIGDLYVRTGQVGDAVEMGDSCMAVSRRVGSREMLMNAYRILADAYMQRHSGDTARHYRELYLALKDSVYDAKKFYSARYKLSEYENSEYIQRVSQLTERVSHTTYAMAAMGVIILVFIVLGYVIYTKNRHLHRTQLLLIKRNADLEEREKQNNDILKKYLEQTKMNRLSKQGGTDAKAGTGGTAADGASAAADHDDMMDNQLLCQINDVMDRIETVTNPDFSLQMLADMVGSNTTYVSRVINNTYHKNFKTLLNERRVREACRKLKDPGHCANFTIQTIYEEVGYKTASSFIRAFKKMYNMTPSEYQKLSPEDNA